MSYRDLEIWKLAREAGSLSNEAIYRDLQAQLDLLGRKLNVFIEGVEREHISHPASRIPHPAQ